ncbi:MAG: ankyrin repeat domain-containing protein, partial [Proteobacteria bacterium]|nr:ankyrin repeat domain-containing protein [Pseudomonadota bacterium]
MKDFFKKLLSTKPSSVKPSSEEKKPLLGDSGSQKFLIDLAISGDTEKLITLLSKKNKIDINSENNILGKTGVTALYAASENGHAEVVEALLKNGADPKIMATTKDGKSFSP